MVKPVLVVILCNTGNQISAKGISADEIIFKDRCFADLSSVESAMQDYRRAYRVIVHLPDGLPDKGDPQTT